MTTTTRTRERIPLETFFGNPEFASPKISPDGRRLAFLKPVDDVLNVWVSDTLDPAGARPVTHDKKRGIRAYFWAFDKDSLVYAQDKDGDENWHLYQVRLSKGEVRDLTPFKDVQAQVIALDEKHPDTILLGLNERDKRLHDVYAVSLETGEVTMLVENPGDVVGWDADHEMRVRACKAQYPDGTSTLRVRATVDSDWKEIATWGPDDTGGAHGFMPDNDGLYVETDLDSDTTRLVAMDLEGKVLREIFHHEKADVGPAIYHPTQHELQAVGWDVQRLEWKFFDADFERDFKKAGEGVDADYDVVSRDLGDRVWILAFHSDVRPAWFERFDRVKGERTFLFAARPKLEGAALSAMKPVTIEARDGMKLPAYLTLPDGEEGPYPLVLNVHGGPWARDHWGYHPEVQWLANRGMAVLQVNFRSSTGFGKTFLHAGDRQWGKKMQDDLTDAVAWAVKQGYADEERVAIYGGSYGGYAALAGAAFTPDVYACAVDIVGPSNLITLLNSIPPYWELQKHIFNLRVGNVETEPEFLKEISPLFSADAIKIPMLIAQGANDPRVKQAEAEQIVETLRKKNKPVEYLLFEDEGHGFARPENRMKFYAAAEAFLEEHLGLRGG